MGKTGRKIVYTVVSKLSRKHMQREKVWKKIPQNINSDFLRKWELNYGWILLSLYISVLSKFSTRIIYTWGVCVGGLIYEKQIQCEAKTLFESFPLLLLPPPPNTLMSSCSLPSISLSQHGSQCCNYVHVCPFFPV